MPPHDVSTDPWPVDQTSMLTVEGYLHGLGKLSSATGWRRWVARALALLILGPLAVAVVAVPITLLWSQLH
jgi:hypothetical protein